MKKIFSIISILLITVFLNSCSKDWLDVNEDPNNAQSASAELVFPSGVVSFGAHYGDWYNMIGGFWSQYWTQSNAANQYKHIDQYQINANDFNAIYGEMYAGALSDLQYVIEEAEANENWTYNLMATAMQAFAWQFMVDLYDAIPYSEAFQGDKTQNFSPAFEDGKTIYTNLLNRIDAALAKEKTELTDAQKNADLVFGGNYDAWVAFANTLKLKMYLRMAYAEPAMAEAGVKQLYQDGATFLSTNVGLDFFKDEENKDNPMYASNIRGLNVGTNLKVSSTIARYFENNNDPRLAIIMNDPTKGYMPQGGFNLSSEDLDPPSVSAYLQSATDPVYFFSQAEVLLLQAEAVARGWGTGDAKALYDAAIVADFARKVPDEDATPFISSGGAYEFPSDGTFEEKLEAIIMAKWASFVGMGANGIEAFFETNRTGYPTKSDKPAWVDGDHNPQYRGGKLVYSMEGTTNGQFPKRLIYPADEVNLNKNFPGQTLITDKVWWDKK